MQKLLYDERATKAFESFSTNLDVLRKFFSFLEPGDQLRFALITPQLRFTLRNYIWCKKYKKLKIHKFWDVIHLLNNGQNTQDCKLTGQEFSYFLDIFGADVEEFNESHGTALSIFSYLPNLVTIEYNYLLLTQEHLRLLAAACTKLEKICINQCCNKSRQIICVGPDIEIKTLVLMENLKSLILQTNYKELKYCLKNDFLKKIKPTLEINSSLESLDIYLPSLSENLWHYFPNLQNLNLYIVHIIRDEELKALANSCSRLKNLTFNYSTFDVVTHFSYFRNLINLTLNHCTGLTYDSLKEILTEVKMLTTFTSIGTKYTGSIFHYYFVSPSIKSIYIDSVKSFDFKSEYQFYKARYDNDKR